MMIFSKSNTLLQATEYQAGSDQRGGVLDPRSDLNSVLVGANVCHRHTAPPMDALARPLGALPAE